MGGDFPGGSIPRTFMPGYQTNWKYMYFSKSTTIQIQKLIISRELSLVYFYINFLNVYKYIYPVYIFPECISCVYINISLIFIYTQRNRFLIIVHLNGTGSYIHFSKWFSAFLNQLENCNYNCIPYIQTRIRNWIICPYINFPKIYVKINQA